MSQEPPIFNYKNKPMVNLIEDKIRVGDKKDVLKLHLMIKCFQRGFNLSNAEINSLVELHEVGYGNEFFENCVHKGFYKSEQTVRNAVAKMTSIGILTSRRRGERRINPDFIPDVSAEKLMFKYLVGNI